MDISKLSTQELRGLLQQLPIVLQEREAAEKAKALEEIESLAKARGFTLDALLGKSATGKARGRRAASTPKVASPQPSAPKYQHPTDPSQTWTGKGRNPAWVEQHLAGGGTLESLLISPSPK